MNRGRAFDRWACSVAVATLACACSSAVNEASVDVTTAAVRGGTLSTEAGNGVVRLEAPVEASSYSGCSATFIAPNVVLTALHCVAYFTQEKYECDDNGTLNPELRGGSIGEPVPAESIEIWVGVEPAEGPPDAYGVAVFGSGSTQICRNDLAVVVLDRDFDLPIASLRLEGTIERDSTITASGYGTEPNVANARFDRSGIIVTDVGPVAMGNIQVEGTAWPNTFVVDEGPCSGDSGGPAFSEETGAILGVYSTTVGAGCTAFGVRNVYTMLQPFAALVTEALASVGRTPVLETGRPEIVEPEEPEPEPEGSGSRRSQSAACSMSPVGHPLPAFQLLAMGLLCLWRSYGFVRKCR